MADGESAGGDERASASETTSTDERTSATDRAFADADDPLVVWTLAAFHTAALVAVLVAVLYLVGALGDLLGGLDTAIGLGLFVVLWASTWWTNRRWLRVVADPETDATAFAVVGTGGKWGGVNGVCFFWVLFGGLSVAFAEFTVAAVLYFFVAGVVGSVLAMGIGGIVGTVLASLDVALFRIADRLVPPPDS